MNVLKSYFPPGYPRNIWERLLLISAHLITLLIIAGIVVMMGTVVFLEGDPTVLFSLPGLAMLGLVGFAIFVLFSLRKASGIVRYWASFLWFGFFLLSTGLIILSSICLHCAGYPFYFPLLCLLGNTLLLVFFWNLGNLDWRILALLFLLFTLLCGMPLFSESERGTAEAVFMFVFTVAFIVYFVFYSLFVIMAVNSTKLLKLPGFSWLFAGFSLPTFAVLLMVLGNSCFGNHGDQLAPIMLILIVISPVLFIIGASIFTLKMDPAQLEERLRKTTPAKEVEKVD